MLVSQGMAEGHDEQRLQRIEQFKRETPPSSVWQYSFRDAILYALSVGCQRTDRKFVYENDTDFATLPTFAVVSVHKAKLDYQQLLPNFDPVSMILHCHTCKFMSCACACMWPLCLPVSRTLRRAFMQPNA